MIFIGKTAGKGRGVFAGEAIAAGQVIEVAPVLVLSAAERRQLDDTLLHDYIFEWGESRRKCCIALGYVSLYNHSYQSNCEYEMNYRKQLITIATVRDIEPGEELFINYNGDWNNSRRVWFPVK